MAFQTGTSSGPSDLVTLLTNFATTNGWTVGSTNDGYKVFQQAARGLYFAVAWDTDNVYVRGCTGYASGSNWTAQPGDCGVSGQVNGMTGPYKAYFFFGTSQYLHVVIEVTTNIFKHFVMGQLNKNSNYTGGAYFDTTYHYYEQYSHTNYPDSQSHRYLFDSLSYHRDIARVRAESDGQVWRNYWQADQSGASLVRGVGRNYASLTESLKYCSVNAFNARTILQPIPLSVSRGSGLFSPIGSPPDIRMVVLNSFNPGQILTIGSDDWYIFPHIQKTYSHNAYNSLVPASGMYGYAYKKVV